MLAKNKFREGWVMLKRPFQFAELSKPLQKMTILYAYSEKPIIKMELTEEGKKEIELYKEYYGKTSILSFHHEYSKKFGEGELEYEQRMEFIYDRIYKQYATQEDYQGEIIQCYIEGKVCKFYPEEYSIISRDTFDYILISDENEYQIEIEEPLMFGIKEIKDRIFYITSRGIGETKAKKMSAASVKDAVIFRPQKAILQMFCREYEIYK